MFNHLYKHRYVRAKRDCNFYVGVFPPLSIAAAEGLEELTRLLIEGKVKNATAQRIADSHRVHKGTRAWPRGEPHAMHCAEGISNRPRRRMSGTPCLLVCGFRTHSFARTI